MSNSNNLRYAHDTNFMTESKEELKSLLMKVNKKNGKAGLKLNIQKAKIMASSSITLWQINGEMMETVTDFILGAPESLQMVPAAMKLKRHLLLGRKVMNNLDSILKNKDITLPPEVHIVKAMLFPVVIYGCKS